MTVAEVLRKPKAVFIALAIAAAAVLLVWWAAGYYGERVFFFDNAKYRTIAEDGDAVTYKRSPGMDRIVVKKVPGRTEVQIYGERYTVRELRDGKVEVEYPSGTVETLDYSAGYPMMPDENGE